MPVYSYRAIGRDGKLINGFVEAETEAVASELLRERGYQIQRLDEKEEAKGLEIEITFLQRVTPKDVVVFSRQLSVLVSASVRLVDALKTVARQTLNPKLKRTLLDVSTEVEGGVRLSDALGKYPKIFGTFYISMVRSGETSGKLEEILLYLADQQEKDYDMRSKVKGAMVYPIFVVIMLFIVGTVMMIFVVPKLTDILAESGVDLPISTKILIGISDAFVHYWWLILGGIFGLIGLTKYAGSTPAGRRVLDHIILKIPVFGSMFRKIYVVRTTQSLSTLIQGGVDVVTSLKVVTDVVGNQIYHDILVETVEGVGAGNSINSIWKKHKEFPQMVVQMVAVGEETGRLQEVLDRLSKFYSREVEATVATLSTAIEPIIMIIMGLAVGGMVSAIILPMYTLAQQM